MAIEAQMAKWMNDIDEECRKKYGCKPARDAGLELGAAPGSAADAALIQLGKLIGDLAAEKNKAWEIAIYNQQIVEMIPMGLPDGTGIMGPASWVAWAKQKLGYGEL